MHTLSRRLPALFATVLLVAAMHANAQDGTNGDSSVPMPEKLFDTMKWRQIGPFRGGRSGTCTGVIGDRNTYYFGACGGGVWKTTDAGRRWHNVSDKFFGGSIGAVAVSDSDPNVVYVGGGEVTVRGNVSSGDGMWKSTDAGKTWKSIGLNDSRHIARIRIHPNNPDLVYAAVMGHLSGPNDERGVFRSKDGGTTWKRILFANKHAGAVDLVMDPANARILYASTWRIIRKPHTLESGGEGSDLWKSTDSGDTWKKLTGEKKGLPKGTTGIIGVTISPVRHERVWAIIENKDGGLFRSEDGGENWTRVSEDRNLRQRAWYYSRVYADTKDVDTVYVLNVSFHRSKDGGKSFTTIRVPHGDNHDLWIDPSDSSRMIEANDGGANVSFDAGRTWSAQNNQPTAQFYRVTTDNHFPYRIYGAQQDNSTVRIASRSNRGSIGERNWESTAGGESGHIAPHPLNPDVVYGGSYGGYLSRRNHRTGENRNVSVWPDNPLGWGGKDLKHRFQWNFPIFFSPHDPKVLYCASQHLCRSTNEGQSWTVISGDLTTNDKSRQEPSGGPITKDNTGVEIYCTIFAARESHLEKGLIWCGSDDGLVHVSRDDGKTWKNVTPKGLPKWMQINELEVHPTHKGGLYLAGTRYKEDDFAPYLYKTTDYGQSWTKIVDGIAPSHFTRVVRADPVRAGLLYAGTERGVYISFDDGKRWQTLKLGLPIVPITDLAVKEDDLIAATQGRSFWVLDNLDHVRQLNPSVAFFDEHLFTPEETYRMGGGGRFGRRGGGTTGQNPASGVVIRFLLGKKVIDDKKTVKLELFESSGNLIRSYTSTAKKNDEKLTVKAGMNRFEWNRMYPGATRVQGMILWGAYLNGPSAVPGKYTVKLTIGDKTQERPFTIRKDPRTEGTQTDIEAQFAFVSKIRDKLTETHEAILRIRSIRGQINAVVKSVDKDESTKPLRTMGKDINSTVTEIEEALYQTKSKSSQDPLNFPIRLNNKLGVVAGTAARGDYRPTDGAMAVAKEITAKIDTQLNMLRDLEGNELKAFNDLASKLKIDHVVPRSKK